MDVTKTVKTFEIHDKENNQVPRVFYSTRPLVAKDFPRNKTIDLKEVWTRLKNQPTGRKNLPTGSKQKAVDK